MKTQLNLIRTAATALALAACLAVVGSANAAIAYFDAPSSNSGTTIVNSGITTVWQQHDGPGFIDFDDSESSNNATTSGGWTFRTTGPAANAANTTAYQNVYGGDDAQFRIVFSGLNAADSQEFFVYNTAAAGTAVIAAAISTNTTQTGVYGGLTTFTSGGTNVLADGSEGATGGDQRVRYSLGSFTGSTSYAFIIDDLASDPGPSDRVTFDGLGIETTVAPTPEPSTFGLAAIGLLAFGKVRRRRRR